MSFLYMEYTLQDLLSKKDGGSIRLFGAGETTKGTVIDANESRILLELDGGMIGMITKKEIGSTKPEDFSIGSQVEAIVINPETDQGLVLMSLKKASQDMIWAEANSAMEEDRIVKVRIVEANKGGLMGDYKGLRCFLPVSQLMPVNYPRVEGAESGLILKKLQGFIGQDFAIKIINVDRDNGKIIISEKSAHQEKIEDTLKNLKVGDIFKGEVSGVLKYGIFVTFQGVEGLVHLSELDWGHVSNPSKYYQLGDKVEVMVIGLDGDKLSLSIKRLTEDEWKKKVLQFKQGETIKGKILRWNPQGIFIDIADDVQGLFELSEFGVTNHEELKLKEGEIIEGVIKEINYDSHRLELKKA